MMTETNEKLQRFSNDKLADIVRNYRQYGYDEALRESAINILGERGVSREELQLSGNYENRSYDRAREIFIAFNRKSTLAFCLYFVFFFGRVVAPFVQDETVFDLIRLIGHAAGIVYLLFLISSFLSQNKFYESIGLDYGIDGALMYLLLGMPLYFIMYFYFKRQMKAKMNEIR